MSPEAPADPTAPQDPAAARVAKRRLQLDELVELGMQLARDVAREQAARAAAAEAGDMPPPHRFDPGLVFSRISRAVRLTLALQARFDEGGPTPEPRPRAVRPDDDDDNDDDAPPQTPHERAEERRATIALLVDDALGREYEGSEAERLEEDVREVLDAFDDETINARPIGEVVEEICKALDVPFDFTLYSWRELEVPPERTRSRTIPPALAALIPAAPAPSPLVRAQDLTSTDHTDDTDPMDDS